MKHKQKTNNVFIRKTQPYWGSFLGTSCVRYHRYKKIPRIHVSARGCYASDMFSILTLTIVTYAVTDLCCKHKSSLFCKICKGDLCQRENCFGHVHRRDFHTFERRSDEGNLRRTKEITYISFPFCFKHLRVSFFYTTGQK